MLEIFLSLFLTGQLTQGSKDLPTYATAPVFASDGHAEYVPVQRLPKNEEKVRSLHKRGQSLGVEINAKSAIIMDGTTGEMLWGKESEKRLPIASLTKLVTTAVFYDHNPGFEKVEALDPDENAAGGANFSTGPGSELRLIDVLFITLTGSANNTARALAHVTGMSDEEFATAMNEKVKALKMDNSSFEEPTGLSVKNISTANDVAKLAFHVFAFPEVRQATNIKEHKLRVLTNDEERTVKATNKLLKSFLNEPPYRIVAGKTGYTEEAGFCLVQETAHEDGRKFLIVILGSETEKDRNDDMKKLTAWAFENYVY